jgi:DNA-directed RNA polymerase subunit omega
MAVPYSMMTPCIEELLERAGSRFALVTLSGKRAGEIIDYYNQLGDALGTMVPPQVASVASKPLSIAMEEIERGKIEAVPLLPEAQPPSEAEAVDAVASPVDPTLRRASRDHHESLWKVRPVPARRTRGPLS